MKSFAFGAYISVIYWQLYNMHYFSHINALKLYVTQVFLLEFVYFIQIESDNERVFDVFV